MTRLGIPYRGTVIREDERKLEEPLLTELVGELDGWRRDGGSIEKTFVTKGWNAAIALVNGIAKVANDADHHPDIHVESYKKVRVVLTTHASGGISRSDVDVATAIDALPEAAARS